MYLVGMALVRVVGLEEAMTDPIPNEIKAYEEGRADGYRAGVEAMRDAIVDYWDVRDNSAVEAIADRLLKEGRDETETDRD